MPRKTPSYSRLTIAAAALLHLTLDWATSSLAAEQSTSDGSPHMRFSHFVEVPLTGAEANAERVSQWFDFLVPAEVFGAARLDLGDLRLYDATDKEIAYALRVREAKYTDRELTAREFNRATGPNDSSEVSLDLGEEPPEHNEIDLRLPGENFRRHARLDASDDGEEWRKLVEGDLFSFHVGDKELHDLRLAYSPSRFRYLRLHVERDTEVDKEPVEIPAVTVHYRVELPGEYVNIGTTVSPRDAVRAPQGPGSAWIVDLGVDRFPCERLEVNVSDAEFARDYVVEAGGPAGSDRPFVGVASGQWGRRAGERREPLVAHFTEQSCARLRLVVTDYSNPPLSLESCQVFGAARQIVLPRPESLAGPLRLYYGNPLAEPPHYDLERNLAANLEPKPVRLSPGAAQANPDYVPELKPLTERVPWLIYAVLSSACVVLAAIIWNIGRTAVIRDDQRQAAGQDR
jgi:hypothetical protein